MTDEVRRNAEAVFGVRRAEDNRLSAGAEAVRERSFVRKSAPNRRFSVFIDEDAQRAAELASELGRIAEEKGLEQATAAAAAVAGEEPLLARHGLGLFAAHHPLGRGMPIPSMVEREAAAAGASGEEEPTLGSGSTGPEVVLDWFREDPLSNEHHEHWHWVYPRRPQDGVPVRERHGELFYYMHEQMLARYDVERVAAGLPPVAGFESYYDQLGEGYDPGLLRTTGDYTPRPAGAFMSDAGAATRAAATTFAARLREAAENGAIGDATRRIELRGREGSDLLGREAENTPSLQEFPEIYGNHHGFGHGLITAASPDGGGVMGDPAVNIRDPAFWRWHRDIDDIHFIYQDKLAPNAFDDAPPVEMSGVEIWEEDGSAPATEVRTEMKTGLFELLDGKRYRFDYLRHVPFEVRVLLRNMTRTPIPVTLRLFLVPHDLFDPAADPTTQAGRQMRRFAIELDKVKLVADPGANNFRRAGRDMSVIRRPAVMDPAVVRDVAVDPTSPTLECTCGWPFTLLIPRGTADGMPFSLFAMVTDNVKDRVNEAKSCGSMSFCGVSGEYPDVRAMGYPFDRQLDRPLNSLVSAHANMALIPVSIRWTNPPAEG